MTAQPAGEPPSVRWATSLDVDELGARMDKRIDRLTAAVLGVGGLVTAIGVGFLGYLANHPLG